MEPGYVCASSLAFRRGEIVSRNPAMESPEQPQNNAESPPKRILVVDDEEVIRTLLREILTGEGYEVTTADDGQEAVELLEQQRFDLVMTDLVMPRANGVEVLQTSKRVNPGCPVVIVTGYPSVETVVRLVRLGAADYLTKPFNVDVVKVTVAKLLEMGPDPRDQDGDPARPLDPPEDGESDPQAEGPDSETSASEPYGSDEDDAATAGDQTTSESLDRFMDTLEAEMARSEWRGHPCSLLIVAVDGFESFHLKSDDAPGEALDTLVRELQEEIRPGDVVGRTGHSRAEHYVPRNGCSGGREPLRQPVREGGLVLHDQRGRGVFPGARRACSGPL